MRIRKWEKRRMYFLWFNKYYNIVVKKKKKNGMYRSMLINVIYLRDVRILFFFTRRHYRTTGHEPCHELWRLRLITVAFFFFFNYYRWDHDTLSRLMDFEGIFYSGYCNLSRTQPRWSRSEDFHLAKRMACDKNIV